MGQKIFGLNKNGVKKKSQKNLTKKACQKILVILNFRSAKVLGQQRFLGTKDFCQQNFSVCENFDKKKFLVSKIFFVSENF